MFRIASALLATGTLLLASGCMTKTVPADQPVIAQIQEISNENPVKVVLELDGQTRFEGVLGAGRKYDVELHNPDPSSPIKMSTGETHKLWWQIHRNGPMGKVGHGEVTIWSGSEAVFTSNSKFLMPLFSWQWWLSVKLDEPVTSAPPAEMSESLAPAPDENETTGPMDGEQ